MSSIRPNRDQSVEPLAAPEEGPVVMLNLMRFTERSSGGGSTGRQEHKKDD